MTKNDNQEKPNSLMVYVCDGELPDGKMGRLVQVVYEANAEVNFFSEVDRLIETGEINVLYSKYGLSPEQHEIAEKLDNLNQEYSFVPKDKARTLLAKLRQLDAVENQYSEKSTLERLQDVHKTEPNPVLASMIEEQKEIQARRNTITPAQQKLIDDIFGKGDGK